MVKIDKNSRVPIYYQLVDIILKEIEEGKLTENSKIPTEKKLCELYGISRATVRQAIGILERENHVYKIQGSGTYVSEKKIEQELGSFYSFADEVEKFGKKPSSEIIDYDLIAPHKQIAKILGLADRDMCYKLVRTRCVDGEAVMYEETFIPEKRFPNMKREELEKSSLYNLMKSKYKVKFDYANESFSVKEIEMKESIYLKEKMGAPCMLIERITYENGKVIEFTKSVVKGDKFKFTVKLNNIATNLS